MLMPALGLLLSGLVLMLLSYLGLLLTAGLDDQAAFFVILTLLCLMLGLLGFVHFIMGIVTLVVSFVFYLLALIF